jgi:hypothetical protein
VERWPTIRAGLIALAILIGLIDGCPLPHRPRPWQQPIVDIVRPVQQTALRPFAWIGERMRIYQRWALYQAPSSDRYRLTIDGRPDGGTWQVLFRAGDPDHQGDAALIDYTRPRGTWDPVRDVPPQYPLFADWMLARVLARHAEFRFARIRLERVQLTRDGVVPTGVFLEERQRDRNPNPFGVHGAQ